MNLTRRSFLSGIGSASAGALFSTLPAPQLRAKEPKKYRAVIIGHTGAGDFGHGFDLVFQGLDHVSVRAVADPDSAGRQRAAQRSGALAQYADYREMLQKEKPDIVSIGTRQPHEHRDMALAAIELGAHLYIEKPMTETPEDADAILSAARAKNIKIAVGHTRRYSQDFRQLKLLLDEGLLGTVLDIRIQGKQDSRAGGEDLIVLGTHDFDILRFYFGDPLWCFAAVTDKGTDVGPEHVRRGREPYLVAGDTVRAAFAFNNNIQAHWASVTTADHWNTKLLRPEKWSFTIFGTKGIIGYQSTVGFAYLSSPFLAQFDDANQWKPLPNPSDSTANSIHPIRDLIAAIETGKEPVCSGEDGRWAVEMVAAVYHSHKGKARVNFPLEHRGHPLA